MSADATEMTIAKSFRKLAPDNVVGGKSCLVKIYPADGTGGVVELVRETLVIGRDNSCDLVLSDESVSRRHAAIEPCVGGYEVVDLKSTNGAYVNDQRVHSRQRLEPGDRVRFGNQILKFLSAHDIESQFHEAVFLMITTDGLTQAYNKRYLVDVLGRELLRSRRQQHALSLVMLDVDRFKSINDTYGHLAGDKVLQELCQRISGALRDYEVLARYGGEEFAVLMPETTAVEAYQAAERLRELVAATPFVTEEAVINVTISLGVGFVKDEETLSSAELIRRADQNLYAAKRAGRNCVRS